MVDKQQAARVMLAEHERLAEKIAAARQSVEQIDSLASSLARLLALRDELRMHFKLEEQGGYMREIRERRPHWIGRIDQLQLQHVGMLGSFGELLDDFDEVVGKTEQSKAKFAKLIAELDQHEHAENLLVQEAYEQDLGSKD